MQVTHNVWTRRELVAAEAVLTERNVTPAAQLHCDGLTSDRQPEVAELSIHIDQSSPHPMFVPPLDAEYTHSPGIVARWGIAPPSDKEIVRYCMYP